ncbi:hypothetical protein E2H08_03350 [Salmonella enterica subsp. enterica serovar Enteritidis]|nr:hypothetical protein [Salmonella enterica subsp. enterica serovar Enteritidis]
MLLIKQFNRLFSVRMLQEYGAPRIIPLDKLKIPRGSVYHSFDMSGEIAPPQTLPIFELEKPAQIRHHSKLAAEGLVGRPIPVPVQGQERAILQYHRNNRQMRRMKSEEVIEKDLRTMLVENYAPILPRYRYADTIFAWYDRLRNLMITFRDQLAYDAEKFPRQNYFILEVGDTMPAFNRFRNTYGDRSNKSKMEHFQSWSLLWLLELFAWADGDRDNSLFGSLDITQLSRINIILTHNQAFTTVNLGMLERLRTGEKGKLSDDQMARRFYRTVVAVMTQPPVQNMDTDFVTPHGDEMHIERHDPVEDVTPIQDLDDSELEAEIARFDEQMFDAEEEVKAAAPKEDVKPTTIVVEKAINHEAIIQSELDKLAEAGRLSAKAYQVLKEAPAKFKQLPNPYNPKESYGEALEIKPEELEVSPTVVFKDATLVEPSWTENTTDEMIRRYNKTMLPKDILGAVASAQRLGLVIHDHRVEKSYAVTGNVEHHTLRIQPVGGEPTTVHFSMPILDRDGNWRANGVDYTMRRQRVDIPIRKVAHDTVALTTAYGKNFVTRSEKVVNDYGRWLTNEVVIRAIDIKDTHISDARLANVFDPSYVLPKQYTMMARRVASFNSMGYMWNFDVKKMESMFGKDVLDSMEKKKLTPVAKGKAGLVAMDAQSQLYTVKGDKVEAQGSLTDMLGIDSAKAPKEVSELSVMGKAIPLGFVFSYYLGLTGMLKHFGVRYEVLPPGQRLDKSEYDMVIRLADAKIVVMCDNDQQRMVVNGMDKYLKHMTVYTESEMEREDVYLNLLQEGDKLTARYINELKLMRNGFVDDMHARILRRMGEPETFIGLLERANEMLTNDHTKPEINGEEMMFVGNARLAYHLYAALAKANRNYLNAPASTRRFELPNELVWGAINSDPSVLVTQGANPIQSIKEKDVVTMGGTGGRDRKTMVKHTREFTKSDLGVVSGDTVDNGDVGITAFLSANPQFATVDGLTKPRDLDNQPIGSLMSFCVGLAPDSLIDDDKRWNFVNIQMGSAQAAEGHVVTPYQTGQGKLVAHRTSSKHARILEQDATVLDVTPDAIRVRYADKTEESFPLGRWFGAHEGQLYPHDMVTEWKKGDKLKAKTVVTYNSKHFAPDYYNPTQVNWKNGALATVVLIEGEETFEDSNAIDNTIAKQLEAETTKPKEVVIGFNQNILEVIKEGSEVDIDTILCTFSDNLSGDMENFSQEAAATLHDLSAFAPRAGVRGRVDKIEIVYHGDIEEMSPSVAEQVKKYDRIRKREAAASNEELAPTGEVDGDYRVDGVPLAYQSICVKFYISHLTEMAAGDKAVVANQLKTTVQYRMVGTNETYSGRPINVYFGRNSVEARIVGSLYNIGTSNFIAVEGGKNVLRILDGENIPLLRM